MQRIIIGTAGHVDHGKTTLVQRLTGIDTDRLPAEKSRGITIELGFAPWRIAENLTADIIDVPGHEKFVRTMSGGVAAVDIAMLLVAADEGIMPQTREHLAIISLLEIQKAVVVLSKSDLVSQEKIEKLKEEIRSELNGSALEKAPIVAVSALKGEGLESLKDAVIEIAEEIKTVDNSGGNSFSRLPVDRCFSIKGFGTVVTGTLWGGGFAVGDAVNVFTSDSNPRCLQAKIRRLEVNGENVKQSFGKHRLAMNLPGLDKSEIPCGSWICSGSLTPVHTVSVDFRLLKNAKCLKNNAPVHVRFGGREVNGRIRFDGSVLEPGSRKNVKIHFEKMLFPLVGDLLIAASYSPVTTVGGGRILEINPAKKSKQSLEKQNRQRELFWQNAEVVLKNYHRNQPWSFGMSENEFKKKIFAGLPQSKQKAILENWLSAEKIKLNKGKISLFAFCPMLDEKTAKTAEKAMADLSASGLQPLDWSVLLDDLPPLKQKQVTEFLAAKNEIRTVDGIVFAVSALKKAEAEITAYLQKNQKITLAEARDLLKTSRKFALAVLSYLDANGVTVRKGDYRTACQ